MLALVLMCASLQAPQPWARGVTRVASSASFARSRPIGMDETARGKRVLIDEALIKEARSSLRASIAQKLQLHRLRDLLAGGSREPTTKHECGKNKYGCDPRVDGESLRVFDDGEGACDEGERAILAPPAPGVVGELCGGVTQLQHILAEAGSERAVILKFKREGCPACNSTIVPLASAAAAYAGRADFLTGVATAHTRPLASPCESAP
jgi:hypothetical protein